MRSDRNYVDLGPPGGGILSDWDMRSGTLLSVSINGMPYGIAAIIRSMSFYEKNTLSALALSLVLSAGYTAATACNLPATAAQADKRIVAIGAKAFLNNLNEDQLDTLYRRIGKGASDWVALAPKLAKGADAANAEGLTIELAKALPRNPKAVLSVITADADGILSAHMVCGMPFIEDTATHLAAYKKQTLRKLSHVTEPALLKAKQNCERVLKAANRALWFSRLQKSGDAKSIAGLKASVD